MGVEPFGGLCLSVSVTVCVCLCLSVSVCLSGAGARKGERHVEGNSDLARGPWPGAWARGRGFRPVARARGLESGLP